MSEAIKNITKDIEIKICSSKDETLFSIDIGLHPTDVNRILDILVIEIRDNCWKTKESIENMNKGLKIQSTPNTK